MLSKPRLCPLVVCVFCWFLSVSWSARPAQAQVYFTGPYGPGGTWNLYEYRGFLGAERIPGAGGARTWLEAHQEAISRTEPFSGSNLPGHLVSFSGPTAEQENGFVADLLRPRSWGAWIGLTDNEAFGGDEAGSNGLAGLGNPPGDGIGWKWSSNEVFDFSSWSPNYPGEDDYVLLNRDTWLTNPSSAMNPYVVEYETRSPVPINLPPITQPSLLSGLPTRAGAFSIREVANNGQLGSQVPFTASVSDAIRSLQNMGPDAIVREYYAPVIDFQAEFFGGASIGPNRPFELLQRGVSRAHQLDNFAMVAHGQIVIPEGQGGDWTFAVSSDDGFELYIPGAHFEPASGTLATAYGSLLYPVDRIFSQSNGSLGYVSLQPGIHDIELVYYENQLHSSVQLSASPGHKTRFDDSFALIGAPAQNVRGRTAIVTSPFTYTNVRRIPNLPGDPTPDEQITSIAQAKQLLNAPDANDSVSSFQTTALNYDNITPIRDDTRDHGRYPGDQSVPGLGNDFASIASTTLSAAGTFTFGFSVLDGGELTIEGAQFSETFGEGVITNGGQSLLLDRSTGDGIALAVVDLAQGHYSLEFVTYNRDGEMSAELFVAPGRVDFFDTSAFALLGPTSTLINYNRPAGLQLVPEPATMWSGTTGALLAVVVAWIRLRSQKKTLVANR